MYIMIRLYIFHGMFRIFQGAHIDWCDIKWHILFEVTHYLSSHTSMSNIVTYCKWRIIWNAKIQVTQIIWGDTLFEVTHIVTFFMWHITWSGVRVFTVFKVTYFKEDTLCEVTLFHVRHMISTDRFIYVLFFFFDRCFTPYSRLVHMYNGHFDWRILKGSATYRWSPRPERKPCHMRSDTCSFKRRMF